MQTIFSHIEVKGPMKSQNAISNGVLKIDTEVWRLE